MNTDFNGEKLIKEGCLYAEKLKNYENSKSNL